ncbi:MAG: hypothetical protein ACAH89_10870 [Rariglobus sp.]
MSDPTTTLMTCVIPAVPEFALGDWPATAEALRNGVMRELAQAWKVPVEADFQPGQIWMGIVGGELAVYAVLRDNQPANRAVQWNEPTWMTGDVLEFFFQAEGRPGYHEFHVTPENCRLQLFFPSRASFFEKRGHKHWAIAESRFESAARVNAERTEWEVAMRIPLARVLDLPREDGSRRFKYCFSRYDYQPGRKHPVMSATAKLSAADFHNMAQWDWAEAAAPIAT